MRKVCYFVRNRLRKYIVIRCRPDCLEIWKRFSLISERDYLLNRWDSIKFATKPNMMRTVLPIFCLLVVVCAPLVCQAQTYTNPVLEFDSPDPTVIRDTSGFYYMFTTESSRGIPIYRSKNLIRWTLIGTVFSEATRPSFVKDGSLWAPSIHRIGSQYVLYYAMSTWGGQWDCGIGVATANNLWGPWTDHGKLFVSKDIGVKNSIDPCIGEENGHLFLFWGSFCGIFAIELTSDGLSVKAGEAPRQVAGTLIEGACIYKRDSWYYLIGSVGTCCSGLESTYHLVVARSASLLGPYVDKNERSAIENHFSTLLTASDEVAGPGHCSEIVTDDANNTWMLYHGWLRRDEDAGRVVFLDQLKWTENGWPTIESGHPSVKANAPVINTTSLITVLPVDRKEKLDPKVLHYSLSGIQIHGDNSNLRRQVVIKKQQGKRTIKVFE